MLRWINEFRNPKLKCARIGHNIQPVVMTGYCTPDAVVGSVAALQARLNGVLAFDVTVTYHVCKRCQFELSDKKQINIGQEHYSLFLSVSEMQRLHKDRYLLRS